MLRVLGIASFRTTRTMQVITAGHIQGGAGRVRQTSYSYRMDAAAGEPRSQRGERRATLRVLIVDDLPEVRYLLEVGLSREAKVRLIGQADNGFQALEKVELLRPDLVVMDLQMPVMDGVEATRAIKERWPLVEVVGFTSSSLDGHGAMCGAGASESFNKGDLKQLLEFIRSRAASRSSIPSP